ncbi:MAG: tetratricopeptide repeat protein [Proteobacteria bacterium]|nr:tetratricopeptide repeat protein [Pseudomonadota bacterium]
MDDFLQRLKQRKLVQWALAYLAAAWVLLQVLDLASGSYHWPDAVMHIAFGVLAIGFVVAVILAWYHGERGAQHVSGMELLIVTLVLAVGGGLLWHFAREPVQGVAVNAVADRHPASTAASGTTAATSVKATPAAALASSIAAQPIPAKSVAVLPFENLSTDKGNAYFADGMQDLILTKLADIGDLKVISRTSTMKYASHPDDLKTIGQQLGVATILEGSVQKAGNQVLINVQLIDARTDSHIWAQSYQRTLDNIFGVEGEVAQKVADALNTKLTAPENERVSQVPTRNAAAYDAFMQGEYYAQRAEASLIGADFAKAEAYYRQAVAHDDRFALAWARLSMVLAAQQGLTFTGDRLSTLAAQAKSALDHALALAPDSPDTRLAQGWYEHWVAYDLKGSLAAFENVLAMQPQNAQALLGAGIIHLHLGHYRDAVELLHEAAGRSPRDAALLAQLGAAELDLRDYARGQQTLRRALAIDPDSALALDTLVKSYFLVGDPEGAKTLLDTAAMELQGNPAITEMRVVVALQRRDYAAARKAAARMQAGGTYSEAYADSWRGDVEWLAGDRNSALRYYQRATPVFEAEVKLYPDNWKAQSLLGWLLMRQGKGDEALTLMRHAIGIASGRDNQWAADGLHWEMARTLAQLGKGAQAAAILDDLMSRPSGEPVTAASLKIDWVWDPIRHDPAFQALLKKYASAQPVAAGASATSSTQ